ncbi:MAG: ABC transporter permease [Eubacterium sp.]
MLGQTWKMAWSAVFANKMRTFLTMLGIIIGVAALVILVSIANGATSSVSDSISSIGSNFITVQISDDKENPLRLTEFYELLDHDDIEASAPIGRTSVTGKNGYTSGTMTIYGTTGAYFEIMDIELAVGRLLKKTDVDNSSYVIVISADTAVEFFGNTNVEGETISLDGRSFKVIGVLAEEDSTQSSASASANSSDEDSTTNVVLEGYIPYSTLTRIGDGNALDITQFYVSSSDDNSMDNAEAAVEQIMLKRLNNDEDAFSIQNQSEIMEAMQEVSNTLSLMLGGIAAISLLVGGIGIMNIMLVSVTERTREIGIRKAIGAGRGTIMIQFLLEAVIVSLAGCILGIGFSWAALRIIGRFMGDTMNFHMDMTVVWIAVIFSAVIGVVFGLYPANKAAKKKPIDALRYTG